MISSILAIGYHGTSRVASAEVLKDGFILSREPYDWLGNGVYFFQDAPDRAAEWAFERHGGSGTVLGAEILLEECMDLLDIGWASLLAEAHDRFLDLCRRSGQPVPLQKGGAHRLDRHVINYAIGVLAKKGRPIHCVRAAFAEGLPVFPNSALMTRSHVQIAVRDTTLIRRVWVEKEDRSHEED